MKFKIFPALICLWLSPVAFGAGWQGFLRLATITGGSADPNHPGWMDVQSVATAAFSNPGGNAVSGNLGFQKFLDLASPALALACAKGTILSSGTLELASTNASLAVFLKLSLTNVVVAGVSPSSATNSAPIEQLSLQAQILAWTYTQFNPASGLARTNVSSIWDFSANIGASSGSAPVFVTTGIRKSTGVELDWNAAANIKYRIYAVPDLTQPFLPIAVVTNAPGQAVYNITLTPAAPAMFYVVEQLPAGY